MEQPAPGPVPALHTNKQLRTIDCIAQSLAVGPIFSAAALGAALAAVSGGIGPFIILIATIGCLGLGYLFAQTAKRFTGSGIVYEYVTNLIGKRTALFASGCYFAALTCVLISTPIVGAMFTNNLLSANFGFEIPWVLVGLIITVVLVAVTLLGVQASVKSQLVIVVLSVIPFLILAVAIIADGGVAGNTGQVFNPGAVAEGGSVFKGLLFAILMFMGFEMAGALGAETKEPKRSIPVAMIATILIVGAFYMLTQYIGTVGSGGPDQLPFDFGALARYYVGDWLGTLIDLAVLMDIIALSIGAFAAVSRGYFTLARDGYLPRALSAVNRRGVPSTATVVIGVMMIVGTFVTLGKYGTGVPLDASGAPAGPPDYFMGFVVAATATGFLVSGIYVLVCVGGLWFFGRRGNVATVIAAIIGLLFAGGGLLSQFLPGLAPTGDAIWGRYIGVAIAVIVLVLVLVRFLVMKPPQPAMADAAATTAGLE